MCWQIVRKALFRSPFMGVRKFPNLTGVRKYPPRVRKFYAVNRGRVPGIYNNWEDTKQQVHRYSHADYKTFTSHQEAVNWLNIQCATYMQPCQNDVIKSPKRQAPWPPEEPHNQKAKPRPALPAATEAGLSLNNRSAETLIPALVAGLGEDKWDILRPPPRPPPPVIDLEEEGYINELDTETIASDDDIQIIEPWKQLEPWSEALVSKPPINPEIKKPEQDLSEEQNAVLDEVLLGHNVFFTGSAGTGKSLVLQHIKYHFEKANRNYVVTAPTGNAAILLNGQTIHSWTGMGIGDKGVNAYARMAKNQYGAFQRTKKSWRKTDVLIIDEISMLSPDFFDMMNVVGQWTRGELSEKGYEAYDEGDVKVENNRSLITKKRCDEPFGGIQLVVCGDFFQLPPADNADRKQCYACGTMLAPLKERIYFPPEILSDERTINEKLHKYSVDPTRWTQCRYRDRNGKPCGHILNDSVNYVYQTKSWLEAQFKTKLLTKVYRQEDKAWINTLLRLKMGAINTAVVDSIDQLRRPLPTLPTGQKPTKLYVFRKNVDFENQEEFRKLKGREIRYSAIDSGRIEWGPKHAPTKTTTFTKEERDKHWYFQNLQAHNILNIKAGTQVMHLVNSGGLVNGSTGIVIGFRTHTLESIGALKLPKEKLTAVESFFHTHQFEGKIRVPLVKFVQVRQTGSTSTNSVAQSSHPIEVLPHQWTLHHKTHDHGHLLLSRIQIPLRLAWAVTIHKSQGMTLDYVTVDIGGSFAAGQAYVGLSRCRTREGMEVKVGSREKMRKAFQVDEAVLKYYKGFDAELNQKLKLWEEEDKAKEAEFDQKLGLNLTQQSTPLEPKLEKIEDEKSNQLPETKSGNMKMTMANPKLQQESDTKWREKPSTFVSESSGLSAAQPWENEDFDFGDEIFGALSKLENQHDIPSNKKAAVIIEEVEEESTQIRGEKAVEEESTQVRGEKAVERKLKFLDILSQMSCD